MNARGVAEGDRVALLLPNSVDFVTASTGLPLDWCHFRPPRCNRPRGSAESIVTDCSAADRGYFCRCGKRHNPRHPFGESSLVAISALQDEGDAALSPITLAPRVSYAIYTSGTTGQPERRVDRELGLCRCGRSDGLERSSSIGPPARSAFLPSILMDRSALSFPHSSPVDWLSFDLARRCLFPRTFFNAVVNEEITYTGFSPSYLRLLLASPQIGKLADSSLDVIALGGEAGSIADIRALWSAAPRIRVFNRYGPTETTIAVTHVHLTPR